MRRLVEHAAASLTAALMLVALAAAPAQAGPQHYGTDPYASGCAGNSFAYRSWPFYWNGQQRPASAQLWYSRTCATNWIVVTGNPAGGETHKSISTDDGQLWIEDDYGAGWSYGMQVYAPPGMCVHVEASLRYPDGTLYGRVFEPAC